MKYKDWLDVWFANYIEPSSKTKTCERYSEIIEKHLKVKLGEYELEELSPIVIQKYITELMQSGNLTTRKGLAANSVNGIITVIQNSLKLAYTLGELKEYTADKIRRPKTKEKEVSCFSLAEQKKIEQAALSSKKRKFIGIVICLYSGLRIGELLALTWADIDFTKGTLAAKIRIHDDMGKLLLATKRRLAEPLNETEQKQMICFWQAEIAALKSTRPRTKKDNLQVIKDAAKLVGVTVEFCGEKPKADTVNEKILIAAMHECLTNTVSHANGKTMTVRASDKNGAYTITITNDSEKPKGEIIEGGGLSGLRSLVERENGKMTVKSTPQFELLIELPQGETI